jgi:hypothetical protein
MRAYTRARDTAVHVQTGDASRQNHRGALGTGSAKVPLCANDVHTIGHQAVTVLPLLRVQL